MSEENEDGQKPNGADQTSMADLAATVKGGEKGGESQQAQSNQSGNPDKGASGQGKGGTQQEMADFIASQTETMSRLHQDVKTNSDALAEIVRRDQRVALNQAVDSAVEKINTDVGGDSKLADTFLNSRYQNDANFKKIFDSRAENPGALDKALGILKDEWKAMNAHSIDSSVAENQRALQDSQRGGQTVDRGQPETERLSKLPDGDFMSEMNRLAHSN